MEDDDIRGALRGGRRCEEEAFRLLRQRYGRDVYACAYRILGNHDDAEDVRQETFIKVFEHAAKFAAVDSMRAYLWTIATNLSLSMLRKSKRRAVKDREQLSTREFDLALIAAVKPTDHREVQALVECLDEIDPAIRAALYSRILLGLSWNEIGSAIDVKPATARVSVSRALQKLRACLEGREMPP